MKDGGHVRTSMAPDGERVNDRNLLEANREWVYIAVDRISSSVASVRFKVMKYAQSGDDKEIFEGPMNDFLEMPGDNYTGKDFIYLNTAYKQLTGNALWEIIAKGKVQPLIPTRCIPIVAGGVVIGFKYTENGVQRTILAKNVLHDRTIDPASPHWGKGKLSKVARWVETSSYANEFLSRFFVNGAAFGGFIETEEESQERIKLIKAGLVNTHVGVENAHKIGILPKGSKFSATTSNMADMEMGATDDRYRDKILAGFGVPKTLVGLTTEVNRASAEASEYIYTKYTVKPAVDDLIEFLNVNVAPMLDATGRYYFAYDAFIPDDQDIKLRERTAALASQPYMTVNEVRASVGLPAIPNGDVVYSNPAFQPLGSPAPVPVQPGSNEDEEPDKEPKKAMPMRARSAFGRERMIAGIVKAASTIATAHNDPDEAAHKSFVGRVDAHEKLVAQKVRDFNNRQEREVQQRLKQITKGVKKGDLFDMDGEVGVLIDFVGPMLAGLMIEQAIAEYSDQGFAGTLDPHLPSIRKAVAKSAKRLAQSYNDTTARLITKTLNEGIEKGDPLPELSDRVAKVYEFSNTYRADQVARTESFYIANEGSKEAYRQSGVVQEIRWYTAMDDKVCEFCGPEDGKVVGIEDDFYPKGYTLTGSSGGTLNLDYRAMDVPPLHPNCRCFIRPETIDAT